MKIFPAIDIIDGKCVRLTQGDYEQKKIYNEDPLAVAQQFEEAGIKQLHVVDLDGAKAGHVVNWKTLELLAKRTSLTLDVGGGIKTREEATKLFETGVSQINIGSMAVKNPEVLKQWLHEFGPERIILSADVRNEHIAINGWQDNSTLHIVSFVQQFLEDGLRYVTCTDIATDGMLTGPNVLLYKKIRQQFPSLHLIASGGVSALNDLRDLEKIGVYGAIVGKAIYETKISLSELKDYAH
jgi:phosphoribosylformimino-5-aminoimidazole carboxamide ribotide isomerase